MRSSVPVFISVLALALGALAFTAPAGAHAPGASEWSWTPALCKSYLKQYGVEIDDGRSFRAATVYCAGLPECVFDRSAQKFYYDHFVVALIDNNLVYRTMRLHVTEKESFRVDRLRVFGKAKTTAELATFKREGQALAARIARTTQASCTIEP